MTVKKMLNGRTNVGSGVFVLLSITLWSTFVLADPVLPGLFSDHLVLQRGREVPVWGWADPGEKITVTMAGVSRDTIARKDGRWKITLPAMKAGGPFLITVQGRKAVFLKDVLVGEVWVLSGQSNMAFALHGAEDAATEIPAANHPEIRLFTVPEKDALEAQQNVAAGWKICSPATAEPFSAVAYFFGRELFKKLGVPIGLIHSSWPGTGAEDWASEASLRAEPELKSLLDHWESADARSKQLARGPADFEIEFDDFELIKDGQEPGGSAATSFSNFDDGAARTSFGSDWTYNWQGAANAAFDLAQPGRGGSGFAARVSGKLDAGEESRLQAAYSPDGLPVDLSAYAGIRFYYRGKGTFRIRSLQPTIYDWDDYGTGAIAAGSEWQPITIWFKDLKQDGWGIMMPFTQQSLSGFTIEVLRAQESVERPPSGLYQGMIAPLIPYAIRGAVWYQGEGNADRAYQYRKLLPALIKGWRDSWGEGDFPFLIVQLPNFGERKTEPGGNEWAELREAQLMALRLPNTGLAVTIELGEAGNVHPHKKAEVGRRLAVWALGTTYAQPNVPSGPLYESMKIEGEQIRLRFRNVGGGLEVHGTQLQGFAVAGADRVFHWADARIDGETIVVSSSLVAAPVAVRYGWAGNPECNLFNHDGLPASPFRSDDWPGITVDKK
jgi:sialate O-acetylesterase